MHATHLATLGVVSLAAVGYVANDDWIQFGVRVYFTHFAVYIHFLVLFPINPPCIGHVKHARKDG